MRPFLGVLKTFDGMVLTNELCVQIEGELIRHGLYRPMRRSAQVKEKWADLVPLEDEEVAQILLDNPQDHKEYGFDVGWPSRFDTSFKLMKWFGFVFYEVGQAIEFSDLGNAFIQRDQDDSEPGDFTYDENLIFLNAFVKYHRQNPFQRVLNHNKPLILMIQVIKELELIFGDDSPGLARHELPFLLVWRDSDAKALAKYIESFRKRYRFSPSDEVVYEACEEILGGWHVSIQMQTVVREEPDEILRKFRLTGLFSLRGNGRFVSLNHDRQELAEYILNTHAVLNTFATEREYFDYASEIDQELLALASERPTHSPDVDELLLKKWASHFGVDKLKAELILLARKRPSSDDVLRLIPAPVRFEFLTALFLAIRDEKNKVLPHYIADDEGIPTSHAPGNTPDIEVFVGDKLTIYEVSLITGRAQLAQELIPITRHLKDRITAKNSASMVFVAPSIHADSNQYRDFIQHTQQLEILNFSVEEFVA